MTIICQNKEQAKQIIEELSDDFILDWQFMEDGTIKMMAEEIKR